MMETTRKYISENCTEDGSQLWDISSQQKAGLISLKRRIREEDLVAMELDKSKRMTLMMKQNYVDSALPLIAEDMVISVEQQHHIERSLNGHTLQLARTFMLCFNQGDLNWIKSALINEYIEPTPLRAVRKDHKEVPEQLQEFGPPSRPIGDGNNAPDSQLSWILANICQRAADSLSSQYECTSTEDMLSTIDEANMVDCRPSGQVCISLNAVALYPSLEKEETSYICAEMVVNSGVYFEAMNWEEAELYLVLTGKADEIPEDPEKCHQGGYYHCHVKSHIQNGMVNTDFRVRDVALGISLLKLQPELI